MMYGHPDPAVLDADRYTARQDEEQMARDEAIDYRYSQLVRLLQTRPTSAVVPARYTMAPPHDLAVIAADMAGWVQETQDRPDDVMARAMFSVADRTLLIEQYALARATTEIDYPLSRRTK